MYDYKAEKARLFTENAQQMFLNIRDNVQKRLAQSGAITMGAAIQGCGGGDSWCMMACVDRLVEIGELREISQGDIAGQYRIFVATNRS